MSVHFARAGRRAMAVFACAIAITALMFASTREDAAAAVYECKGGHDRVPEVGVGSIEVGGEGYFLMVCVWADADLSTAPTVYDSPDCSYTTCHTLYVNPGGLGTTWVHIYYYKYSDDGYTLDERIPITSGGGSTPVCVVSVGETVNPDCLVRLRP